MSKKKSMESFDQAITTKSHGDHPVELSDMIGLNIETENLLRTAIEVQILKNTEEVLKASWIGPQDEPKPAQVTEARDAIQMSYKEWFKTVFVAKFEDRMANFGTAYEVPLDITEMTCGCKRDQGDTTVWTIQSEPFEKFEKYLTSQVMVHSDCGKNIGEIPTPFVHDLR